MRDFIITTELTSDLPDEFIQEHNIKIIPLYYKFDDDDTVYGDEVSLEPSDFYNNMRRGAMPTTMASNPEYIEKCFRNILDAGFDVLHIAFSSALSSSYNTACMVAAQLGEEYTSSKIIVIDSKAASMGEGLLVYRAVKLKEQGMSIDETAEWVENNKLHLCHQFTVDDLFHLHRGGRVSKATAVIGTLINVKPVLHVDDEGALVSLNNVRGRKKALNALVNNMLAVIEGYDNDMIFISHGDCIEDAEYVARRVTEATGITNIMINYVCPTIGAHSGPGTVALFFLGERR